MNLNRFNLILAITLTLNVAVLVLIRVDNSQPNFQVKLGDDMTDSPAYAAYEPNESFANGRTLQGPVPRTIARGTQQFHFAATPEDARRAGVQLANPFTLGTEQGTASAKRGRVAYQIFCVACHAADGVGKGPVARRGFPPPPSLLTGKSKTMKDGQLFHILTYGQNSMPPFAAQLAPERRWDVVNYIRQLQSRAQAGPDTSPTTAVTTAASETDKSGSRQELRLLSPGELNVEPKP